MPLLPPVDDSEYESEFGPFRLNLKKRNELFRVMWIDYPGKCDLGEVTFVRDSLKSETIFQSLQRMIWFDQIRPDLTDHLWMNHVVDQIWFQSSPLYRRGIESGSFIELSTGHYGAVEWRVCTWDYPMGWNHCGNYPACVNYISIDNNARLNHRVDLRMENGFIVGDDSEWMIAHVDHHLDLALRGLDLRELRDTVYEINSRPVIPPDLKWRPV